MPQRLIFTAAYRCGKTQQLAQAAQAALDARTDLDQILALTVHRPAAQALRDALTAATDRSVATTTLRRRAVAILKEHPRATGLPHGWGESALLSGSDRRLLIWRAWQAVGSNKTSLYQRRGEQPGALDWITLLFDHFSAWSGTATLSQLPPIKFRTAHKDLQELWAAYQRYLQLCRQHGVVAFNEVYNRAADALRNLKVRHQWMPGVLLLDDLDLFQPAELLFVASMIGPETRVYAASATPFDPNSPLAIEQFIHSWLAQHGFAHQDWEAFVSPHPQVIVAEYASPDDEAHGLAQHIVAAASGRRLDDFAIVAFDNELVPLLQRVLPRYGLRVEGEEARNGYTLALAPLALAGLKLIAGQPLTSAETIALLRHPALGLPTADVHTLIDAVMHEHVQPFNGEPASQTIRSWNTLSGITQARLQQLLKVTHAARQATSAPSIRIERWLAELDLVERCWAQTAAALETWAVAVDRRQWERLLAFLRQAEALHQSLGDPLPVADAVEVWIAAQSLVEPEGKPHQHPVRIWRPEQMGGCTAAVVFATGLHEAGLPRTVQPLPVADDATLTATFGSLPGFVTPQANDRAAAWQSGQQMLKRTMGRAAETVHVSYSRTDRQGRRRLPSPIMAAQLNLMIDRRGQLQLDGQAQQSDQTLQHVLHHASPALINPPYKQIDTVCPTPDQPFTVTPSAIEDYFNCPRRCFYARELKLYDVASSPRQALGNVVHDVLHELLNDAQRIPISEERAQRLIDDHWINDEQRWGSALKRTVFRQLTEKAVTQLARYEVEQGSAGQTFLGAELDFTWKLPDTDVVIKGRIDRIDRTADGLQVIDYKLGQNSPSISALLGEFVRPANADTTWRPSDIQLPVYALALEQGEIDSVARLPDERVQSVALVYPLELYTATGRVSARGHRVLEIIDHASGCAACETVPASSAKVGKLCRSQLVAVADAVQAVVERMQAGEWQPDPREGSKTCVSCPFRPICTQPQ